jgi:hypothetical protein
MKKMIVGGMFIICVGLCNPRYAQSQGTLDLSSLGAIAATEPVGSDSWVAAAFRAGNNPGGYVLDSIELQMEAASGSPNGFSVEIYEQSSTDLPNPGSSLATLEGATSPESAGVYTYTFTGSGITLTPDTEYFIVATAATASASGSFTWALENPPLNYSIGSDWTEGGVTLGSSDGLSWSEISGNDPQIALTATAVPEPETLYLLSLPGVLFFAWRRWRASIQKS